MSARSSELLELANLNGVKVDYYGFDGKQNEVSAETLAAVLSALGVAAHNDEEIHSSLAVSRDAEWRNFLPPTVVVRQGDETSIPVHVNDGASINIWIEQYGAEHPLRRVRNGLRVSFPNSIIIMNRAILTGAELGGPRSQSRPTCRWVTT